VITIDYVVNKPITRDHIIVGGERSTVRQTFENDQEGMLRFKDLQEGSQVKEVQLTWTHGDYITTGQGQLNLPYATPRDF